ncbi:MAG TPA: hypothetical protein VIG62_25575 [Blastocatellia bacterium]
MKFTVHAEHPPALNQALRSDCDAIRYGADLCEFKLPNDVQIREFVRHLNDTDKEMSYVCPRVPQQDFATLERHLSVISEQTTRPVRVIANDWGVLNQIIDKRYPRLVPYLGRQLVAIPGRGRPSMADLMGGENLFRRIAVKKVGGLVFNKTNLHFKATLKFLLENGVEGADIDWVPQSFKEMKDIVKAGLQFSVHLGLVIVAVVRRCHTARYFNEPIPERCSMPCFKTAFLLNHELFGNLYMDGNTIFAKTEPTQKEMQQLYSCDPAELVVTMGAMTKINTAEDINAQIQRIKGYTEPKAGHRDAVYGRTSHP